MTDFLNAGPFTAFDMIVAALMVFSGLMAFARGFIRELASILAFLAALVAAFFAWKYIGPTAREYLPEGWSLWISDLLVVVIAFLLVYIVAAWLGAKFSRIVRASTDIGLIDRVAGFAFGVFRGAAVVVLVLLATRPFIEDAQISWITEGFTYPYFVDAVIWVQNNFMVFAETVREVVPDGPPDSP